MACVIMEVMETVYCPKCRCGLFKRGFMGYACHMCGVIWYIAQEGFISEKRLAEIHEGVPLDIE
ncbi:hypothetical protein LCGC14_0808090 [marine sediment metagenome]|uniref:Uncharacterized protein n=1 Tax=marine sediment metagenome TaxID=412755 RepID=A0A0F9SV24_9ZZZZ